MSRPGSDVPIWARPEPGARRPRFTREQIAAVALAIADAEGFEAVSMRRVAAELGSATMSLYHYVRTKADLVALMDDAIMGESVVPDGELPADWREAIIAVARQTRAVFLRHPWALRALQGEGAVQGSPVGPNTMRHFEQSLAAVANAPFDLATRLELLAIVDDYVFGHVLRAGELRARKEAEPDPAEVAAITEYAMAQMRTGAYPNLEALSAEPTVAARLGEAGGVEARFELGLELLLDGAVARLTS